MIPYLVKKSKRKTIAIEVQKDLTILVRSPLHYPRKKIDNIVESHQAWIKSAIEKQNICNQNSYEPSQTEIEYLKQAAYKFIPPRVEYYSNIMGLHPTSIKITSARTRFGSCSEKNSICFSWRLMMYPNQAIEYVIVHELAHIIHKNHGTDFYACIAEIMPDYQERIAMLKSTIQPTIPK